MIFRVYESERIDDTDKQDLHISKVTGHFLHVNTAAAGSINNKPDCPRIPLPYPILVQVSLQSGH